MKCPCENTKRSMPKCDGGTPPVIEINGGECPVLFHTVNIPASVGTVETLPPTPGAYRNARVFYEADNIAYLYDSDGIPQLLSMPGEGGGAVESVNGQTGVVVLDANDVGAATPADLAAKQDILTAGTNIQISGNTISATDTTYSNFVGTDGVDAGTAGLVPAPATTDAGKFLKADGTWDTAGGTLYTTYGTNEDGAMTQKATTDLVYTSADPKKINIGDNGAVGGTNSIVIGSEDSGTITGKADQIIIGHNITSQRPSEIGIGHNVILSTASGDTAHNAIAIGDGASALGSNTIAIGYLASTSGNVNNMAIGNNARANHSHTIAVGMDALASQSNAMAIGHSASASSSNSLAIGVSASASSSSTVAIGSGAQANQAENVAVGTSAKATGGSGNNAFGDQSQATASGGGALALGFGATASTKGSVAIGATSKVLSGRTGVISVGNCGNDTRYCYGGTVYRIIEGVHDGIQLHDAATVAQGNTLATSAPTTTTEGVLGQLYTDTTGMHTYQLTAIDTTDPDNPVYTWTQRW